MLDEVMKVSKQTLAPRLFRRTLATLIRKLAAEYDIVQLLSHSNG